MKLSRLKLFWGGIVVCTVITSIYAYALYCNYPERVAEWNVQAEEAFVRALEFEIQKRRDSTILFISADSPEMKTLENPYRSSVTVKSKYGTHDYEIPRVKFDNSLIKDTEKRMLLSYVLEKHPLNADTLNTSWHSLLIRKSIKANTGIRLSTIDLLKQTSVVCSPDSIKILEGDSLLSRYLGFRCEVEATGFVSYSWWQALEVWPPIIILLLLWFCFFLLFSYYKQITLFLRRKFVKKETVVNIQEKTIVVERKMHLEEVVEQTGLYELADGTILDSRKGLLINGEKTRQVQPQTTILLKLLLCAKDYRLTAEEINKNLWEGKGNSSQIHAAIHRLREVLKDVSSLIVEKEDKYYCLKMPHSIEKNSTEA